MNKLLIIAILVCLVSALNAQSTYLEVGKSGIGAGLAIQESYWEDGFMGTLGYSFKGKVDVNIWGGMYTYDHLKVNGNDIDQKETALGVTATWWPLRTKTGKDRGIDIGMFGGYEYEEYTIDNEKSATSDGLEIGTVFAINFEVNEKCFIQPFYSLGYSYCKMKEESNDDIETYKGAISSYGVAIIRKLCNGNRIVLTFETDTDALQKTNDVAYEFGIGYVIGF